LTGLLHVNLSAESGTQRDSKFELSPFLQTTRLFAVKQARWLLHPWYTHFSCFMSLFMVCTSQKNMSTWHLKWLVIT